MHAPVKRFGANLVDSELAELTLVETSPASIETFLQARAARLGPQTLNHLRRFVLAAFNAAKRAGRFDLLARPSGFEVLLALSVGVRPVVLAPFRRCATRFVTPEGVRPGPSTPDAAPGRAARGGGSDGYVLPNRYCLPGLSSRRSQLARVSARASCWFESCERAHAPRQPRRVRRCTSGGALVFFAARVGERATLWTR